jgi:hypothetical protein
MVVADKFNFCFQTFLQTPTLLSCWLRTEFGLGISLCDIKGGDGKECIF